MGQIDIESRKIGSWVFKERRPSAAKSAELQSPGAQPHLIVMLHGWTGDENAMWIFANRLPKEHWLVAPRGLYSARIRMGGYSWTPPSAQGCPRLEDFLPTVAVLDEFLVGENFPNADLSQVSLVGFSQGAALTYVFSLLRPNWIRVFAGLSGFLPEGAEALLGAQPLTGKRGFIAHGTRDELVPVEKARQSVHLLERGGAQVAYCEDEVGHKLSADCFSALENFLQRWAK